MTVKMSLKTNARKLQKLMGWPYQKCFHALADKTPAEQKELLEEVEKDTSEDLLTVKGKVNAGSS